MALEISLRKSKLGEKSISFIEPSISNKLSKELKILNTTTSFTHYDKKLVLKNLSQQNKILITAFITIISKFLSSFLLLLLVLLFESLLSLRIFSSVGKVSGGTPSELRASTIFIRFILPSLIQRFFGCFWFKRNFVFLIIVFC